MYGHGKGVPQDNKEAMKWFGLTRIASAKCYPAVCYTEEGVDDEAKYCEEAWRKYNMAYY